MELITSYKPEQLDKAHKSLAHNKLTLLPMVEDIRTWPTFESSGFPASGSDEHLATLGWAYEVMTLLPEVRHVVLGWEGNGRYLRGVRLASPELYTEEGWIGFEQFAESMGGMELFHVIHAPENSYTMDAARQFVSGAHVTEEV